MKITKKALSILLAIAMLITAVPMGITGFAADVNVGTEKDTVNTAQSDTLIRPAVTLTATPVTRITSSTTNPMKGTAETGYTIAATPSGIPQTSYTYAASAYAGETPTATTIVFAPGKPVTDVNITCSNTSIQFNPATVADNVYTCTIKDGAEASVGETLIFTVTYKYVYTDTQTGKTYNSDKTFSTTCYSYVESVLEPAGIYSYRRTNNGWGSTIGRSYIASFILGEGTYSESTNYSGSTNFNGGGFIGDYGKMLETSSDGNSRRFNSGYSADANRPVTHIYMDKGANSTLADLNARVQVMAGNQSDEDDEIPEVGAYNLYEHAGNVQTYSKDTEENHSQGGSNSSALAMSNPGGSLVKFYLGKYITYPFTGAGPAQASATADTTAEYTITIDLQTAAQWSDLSIRHSHLVKVTVFNKANLLAAIQKVMNTEASNMLITTGSADGKGYNPQSWYYSAGWQAFQNAYNQAVSVYNKPNTTQSSIDSAKTALETAYNGLTLKEADYTDLDYVVGRANTLDKTLYTPASWARLETALAQYQDNINILYQPKVDQITLDIQTAMNNLEYADADYTKVDAQVAVANGLIYSVQDNYGLTVEEYYSNWSDLVTVIESCGYAYDSAEGEFILQTILKRDKQSTVDTYPTIIAEAITNLKVRKANFTQAVAAMNNYITFKNANGDYLDTNYSASIESEYQELQDYQSRSVTIEYQDEIDAATASLNQLLANPVYKSANYTAADAAIARYTALDRDIYEDLTRVDNAYAALDALYGLDARSQAQINEAVAELTAALDNLKVLSADYTKVYEAIEAVEQKKAETLTRYGIAASVYYSNWSAVENAVNNVDYNLPFDQQATIDAYATTIMANLNKLQVATADYGRLSALEEQAFAILENEADYTPESIENLTNALFAIDNYNHSIDKQSIVDGWADDIQAAIDAMEYVDADYSKVRTAIQAANAALAESQTFADAHNGYQYYSVASIAAVNNAINNVQYGLKKDKQTQVDSYATAINMAVNNLTYGPADYTPVEEAKLRIPKDLSIYTDASVANLNSALNYNTAYTTNRQSKVDEIAASINNAIDTLVLKTPLDQASYTAALARLAADTNYQTGVYTSASENAVKSADNSIKTWLAAEARYSEDQAEFEALVADFNAKIDALAFKPIDTAAYEAQVARIPVDTTNYTDASVKAVNDAKAAADAFLAGDVNITDQSEFDILVAALRLKIAALEFKPIDTTNYYKQVERIPANLNLYTDATVQELNEAKAAVDTFLAGDVNILHQADLDALVLTLRSKINALAFKPIDTAAYEAQVARIPADTTGYTDDSVQAVTDAKAAVDAFLAGNVNITNQSELDALVATLTTAIDNLAEKVTAYFRAKEGSTCVIEEGTKLIYGLETRMSQSTLKNTYLAFEGVTVTIKPAKGRYVGTGSTVTVDYPDGTTEVYTVVVFGDMDGSGQIDSNDLNSFGAYITKNVTLTAAQKKAMNLDNDSRKRLNSNDLLRLQRAVSSGTAINQVDPSK